MHIDCTFQSTLDQCTFTKWEWYIRRLCCTNFTYYRRVSKKQVAILKLLWDIWASFSLLCSIYKFWEKYWTLPLITLWKKSHFPFKKEMTIIYQTYEENPVFTTGLLSIRKPQDQSIKNFSKNLKNPNRIIKKMNKDTV